ncbi:secreted protein with altered thrombospondin repeat domain, putative [Plasmodium chabaudi chabaudi]|uniref:Secreted protein with altered thrombospondin repeat domain, putative n=2 Tax=Plasmodium chabaudi TaxID=5825 RepID=A0A077TIX7_PLACU|nr:secreted protein with altered thrombospondin repeat domain, putative [Plasmodium chabaudi chabaudi]SCL97552.1 secreted protein with altered thrombospondin repeat domain, putative [Plasmodium chabaudi chabaudi]SCM00531.1 secreted protein with altered thrombospondin repeat domain, putative [Plasmodium chabaudi adami]SCM05168.1 secreted protein with altered thrombospondin repeat domain, putative [Plasmodium chabaudi adami]VTZ67034.1 secreted protein with altered thrombospondin repeat domain, pu|eukprot:XP_016653201.1 secreted protein with altered thrombospondin repeat domain, putative [Plasmodium chabaudi chabaudi]
MTNHRIVLFFFCFFFLIQKKSNQYNRDYSKINSIDTDEYEDKNKRKRDSYIKPDVGADTCVIFSAKEGDPHNCWCPRGYIMCSEEDVTDLQTKLEKIEDKNARTKLTPSWVKILCDDSKEYGFKNMSVVIDYELAVICKDMSNKENPDFEIIGASGYIPNETVINEMKADPTYVPRKCTVNNFYLCKQVENDNVNCQYSPWSDWTPCIDNKQKRMKKVVRSNQNNTNFCLWNNKKIPRSIIEQTRSCE